MSLRMTIKQFEELNLFSNKNLEKVVASVINESSNAALVSMFEDSVILLDHEEGQFYAADYSFDGKKLQLTLENFQPIDLEKEDTNFTKDVQNFFEDENVNVEALTEAYKSNVLDQEKFVNELISEALSAKDFENNENYKELAEANDSISIKDKPYFKAYVERLNTHPLTEVKYVNFKDKVVVSLMETEKVKLVNSSAIEKAADLWKRDSFKKLFTEAATLFVDDVDAGREKLYEMFEQYPQLFLLDKADRHTLFGKAIITNAALREHLEDLQKGLDIVFEEDDVKEAQNTYLNLMEGSDDEESDDEGDDSEEDSSDEDQAKELSSDEIQEIADELSKVAEKVEDEKLKEKLDKLVSKLTGSVEEGTRPDLIKEAVHLLTI